MDYSKVLSQQFQIKEEYAKNIISLLDDGNTIPFIARYRKEMHGSMDDQLIREFSEKLEYLRSLDKRREEIRTLIDGQEKLTDEISLALDNAETLSELEDIYRPFRPKRKTRASVAKAKGLQGLADSLYAQNRDGVSPQELAQAVGHVVDVARAGARPLGLGAAWSVPDFSECGLGCDSCECAMPFAPLGWGEVSQA